jgi:hypothetical protein
MEKNKQFAIAGKMLDACHSGAEIPLQRGYWISSSASIVNPGNIQHHVLFPMTFKKAA